MPVSNTWRKARPFIFSTAIITLLAGYSVVAARYRNGAGGDGRHHGGLRARSSEDALGQECRDVHLASDQCAFILLNCEDDEAGLLHYLTFYYCTLGGSAATKGVAFAILTAWLGLLFTTIGIAASDFFSVNLSTIAGVLGLSESLAGVTFLAFGNGSPDVFSTFAAMGSNSGSMAVGELIGAASFITAVVAGSMALVREFKVSRRTFVRDVCFFIVAVSFAMVFLADGQLRLWECFGMIGFYLFYVAIVVGWHWYTTRRRRRKLKESAARGHLYAVGDQARDELEPYQDYPNEEDEAAPMGGRQRSLTIDISALERGPRIEVNDAGQHHGVASPDDEATNQHITAEMTSSMRVNRPRWSRSNTTITPIRPSLMGALEFRSVLASLQRERNMHLHPLLDRGNTESPFRSEPIQHNRTTSLGTVPERVVVIDEAVEPSTPTPRSGRDRALSSGDRPLNLENDNLDSPTRTQNPASRPSLTITSVDGRLAPPDPLLLAPSTISDPSPSLPPHRPRQQLSLQIPSPSGGSSGGSSPAMSPFPGLSESPLPLSTPPPPMPGQEERTRYPFLPVPSMPDRRRSLVVPLDEPTDFPKPIRGWPYQLLPPPHILFGTLFPTLQGWREKPLWDKAISLISVPSIFVLVTTLPVVETDMPEEDSDIDPMGGAIAEGAVAHATASEIASEASDQQDSGWLEYRRRRASTTSRSPLHSPVLIAIDAERRTGPHESVPAAPGSGTGIITPTVVVSAEPPSKPLSLVSTEETQGWARWLVALQIFTGPLFVVFIVWANMEDDFQQPIKDLIRAVLCALVFSLVALAVLLLTTTPERKPKYHFLLCFLGFVISVAWISTVAGEVVGVLKAFGVILGISEAILGLTIFAVGNSLGDLVADVTVARLGYPVMALAACFGGPMLNILLGVGIGGAWMIMGSARAKHKKHPDRPLHYKPYKIQVGGTLIISAVTVLLTLVILLIVVPYNKWVMSRKIGWGLIAIWTVSAIVNLVVELTGAWEDVS